MPRGQPPARAPGPADDPPDVCARLDALRERLDQFQQRLDEQDPDDVPTPPADIDELDIQHKADKFYTALTRLGESFALPNPTLHLQRRRARGLERPPAPFGHADAARDIWATTLVHMDPLLNEMDALPAEWEPSPSAPPASSQQQNTFGAHSLLPICDSVMIDQTRTVDGPRTRLPPPVNRARLRARPSLPSWVHPMDAAWAWNPRLGLAPTSAPPRSWLSDVRRRIQDGTTKRPGQYPMHPVSLRDVMHNVGPIYGGQWMKYPTREAQLEVIEAGRTEDMDLLEDGEVIPILANDHKLRRWAERTAKSVPAQSLRSSDPATPSAPASSPPKREATADPSSGTGADDQSQLRTKRPRITEPTTDPANSSHGTLYTSDHTATRREPTKVSTLPDSDLGGAASAVQPGFSLGLGARPASSAPVQATVSHRPKLAHEGPSPQSLGAVQPADTTVPTASAPEPCRTIDPVEEFLHFTSSAVSSQGHHGSQARLDQAHPAPEYINQVYPGPAEEHSRLPDLLTDQDELVSDATHPLSVQRPAQALDLSEQDELVTASSPRLHQPRGEGHTADAALQPAPEAAAPPLPHPRGTAEEPQHPPDQPADGTLHPRVHDGTPPLYTDSSVLDSEATSAPAANVGMEAEVLARSDAMATDLCEAGLPMSTAQPSISPNSVIRAVTEDPALGPGLRRGADSSNMSQMMQESDLFHTPLVSASRSDAPDDSGAAAGMDEA